MFLQFEGVEGKSEGRKKDSFKNRLCHLPPPPGGRTNRGQSGWDSKQKCVSLAPASKKPDPRAPETEPEDKALGGGRAGEGSELCRFQILPCPALSPGASVPCHRKQTAWESLPGEMTGVFVRVGGFHQSCSYLDF